MGVLAILLWSSNIGVSRSLAESIGALTSGGLMFLIGGTLGVVYAATRPGRLAGMFRLPIRYLAGSGAMFAAYMVCLYLAIGLAANRQQTLEVAVLNYLWPSLTLVLAIPILGARVRAVFPIGVVLAVAGAVLAPLRFEDWNPSAMVDNLRFHPWPYVLAAAAALLWSLYSNLSRRWAAHAEGGAVPLFSIGTGLGLLALRPWFPEPSHWSPGAFAELAFMAVFPCLVAYSMWDRAVRRGNVTLVAALSYAIPVLSTIVSSVYLHVTVAWNVWAACALIVAGAVVCQQSIKPAPGSQSG